MIPGRPIVRTLGISLLAGITLMTGAQASSANDYLYPPGETIPQDMFDYVLTTGDRIIRVDPQTGEWISVETITTTPYERALARDAARIQAEIEADRSALLAGTVSVSVDTTYTRINKRKPKGTYRPPVIRLASCSNDATGTLYTWVIEGGTYRSLYFRYNGLQTGNGKVYRNTTRTFTTRTSEVAFAFTRTKAKFTKRNLDTIRGGYWTSLVTLDPTFHVEACS